MKNLPPFYIGQKVIYITGKNMPKNSIHTVTDVFEKGCGCCFSIEIDSKPEPYCVNTDNAIDFKCTHCNKVYAITSQNRRVGWNPESFRATEDIKASVMSFTKIKEKEKEEILINN